MAGLFCQCAALQDWLPGGGMVRDDEFVVDEEDIELRPRGFMGYDGSVSQPVRGNPVRDGLLWFLPVDEKPVRMRVKLYCNALTFEPVEETFDKKTFST